MREENSMKLNLNHLISIIFVLSAIPAIAQTRNNILIARNSNQSVIENTVSGQTFSAFSLPSILGQMKDRQGNDCLGFVGDLPDYTLNLTESFSQLNLAINSQGDTTMAIQAPNNVLYCGDDISATNPNASVTLTNLPTGEYKVWVGAFDQGDRLNYSLTINAH
jgi:hypothetical protein